MDATDTLTRRRLVMTDLPSLMALVREAGWNQTEADWRRMLSFGMGYGLADDHGRVVASAVTLTYGGRIGWIGMVLVAGDWRRRGLATSVLERCVLDLEGAGLLPGLDATPDGEKVYGSMGFRGDLKATRWRRPAMTAVDAGKGFGRTPSARDAVWMTALDARGFGADRGALIASYLDCAGSGGRAIAQRAFLLTRPGRTATHLGPICAEKPGEAHALLSEAIQSIDGPLLIDVPDTQSDTGMVLREAGFLPERPFLRMYRGEAGEHGDPHLYHALAGPELG